MRQASDQSANGSVLVVGGEPAALSCVARLLAEGVSVCHIYPVPWGLWGASRDIGLAYPEDGEPWERLSHALGEEVARQWHDWGKTGVELLTERARESEGFRRGSRLSLARQPQEAGLIARDALERQRLGDEVRLMSGAAASNYAPLATTVHQASFETHAVAFAPVPLCEVLLEPLRQQPGYHPFGLAPDPWSSCTVSSRESGPTVSWQDDQGSHRLTGEVVVVAAGFDSGRLLGRFSEVLVPLLAQAFRSPPLRESSRSSVVGLTASWGLERYRFDDQRRLLGCGLDPGLGEAHQQAVVLDVAQSRFWQRACGLFSDLELSDPQEVLRWGVLFCTTCDGLPLLGPLPGEPRLQLAAGFGTSAWSRGYQAGDELARCLLQGGHGPALMERCSPRRLL